MSAPSPRLKRVLASIAIAAGLGVGAAGIAAAANDSGSPAPASSVDGEHQDPSYRSSIQAPESANENDAEEAKALEALATTTPDQARQAALAAVPGTAGNASLEEENGNVVYSVEVTANGTVTEVKVDAGNGSVLAKESAESESGDAADGPESATDAPDGAGK